jgi:hypothetical protein
MNNDSQIRVLAKALDRYIDWIQARNERQEQEQAKRYWSKQQKQGAAIRANALVKDEQPCSPPNTSNAT